MPWPVHPTGFLGARGDSDTYRIERSLRFNSADSAYLNRTLTTPTNNKKWSYSFWVKRATIKSDGSSDHYVIATSSDAIDITQGNGQIRFFHSGNTYVYTPLYRDFSSWGHYVFVYDSDNATQSDRFIVYFNGSRVSGVTPSIGITSGASTTLNTAIQHNIGALVGGTRYLDGYLTEIHFIDGQALTPSSFGETDAITGRWKAREYNGTYGTNGFYLKFADNSGTTSTTLGKDSSPNGNNWTPNNFSVTAGAGNDSLVDSPTNYGSGIGTVGNFCTWNPLVPGDSAANGNLDVTNDTARGNHELMKYDAYWEVTSTGGTCLAGIVSTAATSTITVGSAKTFGFKLSEAGVFEYANITDGSSFTSQATATTPPFPYASTGASITASINCGQRAFAGTLPTGYKPICTTSLDQPTIQKPGKYMDVLAYTGTGASNAISSLGFSPDLVWIKNRGTTTDHALYDTTRGTQAQLSSNTTGTEVTSSTGLTSFDGSGFTLGTSSLVNTNGTQYVAWSWDAGSTNSTNTSGSITSTVRANPQAGFSIVSYTGTGANATVGHGLGVAPRLVIVKNRSAVDGWAVYHANQNASPASGYTALNETSAFASTIAPWNNTTPTSSVISVGVSSRTNGNGNNHIAYCFSEIEGYSKFGSYTGNGSTDGPFVWCGFRPRWILIKRTDTSGFNWRLQDTQRGAYNQTENVLNPNLSDAESSGSGDYDILSNGFKIRVSGTGANASGGTYIFAAFAESPFKYARAR